MSLIIVEAIRGRSASFMSLPATVSEIFGGQTTPSILVVIDKAAAFLCLFVCVCLYPFFATRPSDRDQIWQAYADRSGNGSDRKQFDLPTPWGSQAELFGGQKFEEKNPGNVMNGRENLYFF